MSEHRKIELPENEDDKIDGRAAERSHSSLLERASGAFGLSNFRAAPMPSRLADAPMKRARLYRRDTAEPAPEPVQTPDAELEEPVAEPSLPVPTSQHRAPAVIESPSRAVSLPDRIHPIDRESLYRNNLIDPDRGATALMEEFRIVKREILKVATERGTSLSRRVLVSSPHAGEGKTFCAANLAIAMAAERDIEVVLVDADFAQRAIPRLFGLPDGAGLLDALADEKRAIETLPIKTDIDNLWVLTAGDDTHRDGEYLSANRAGHVLERLTLAAPRRIVIFDTPPALAASPAAELARHSGQCILIARAEQTGRNALEDACQLLSACADLKLLLNDVSFSPSGRRFGAYGPGKDPS